MDTPPHPAPTKALWTHTTGGDTKLGTSRAERPPQKNCPNTPCIIHLDPPPPKKNTRLYRILDRQNEKWTPVCSLWLVLIQQNVVMAKRK